MQVRQENDRKSSDEGVHLLSGFGRPCSASWDGAEALGSGADCFQLRYATPQGATSCGSRLYLQSCAARAQLGRELLVEASLLFSSLLRGGGSSKVCSQGSQQFVNLTHKHFGPSLNLTHKHFGPSSVALAPSVAIVQGRLHVDSNPQDVGKQLAVTLYFSFNFSRAACKPMIPNNLPQFSIRAKRAKPRSGRT
ncbi:unnamed protein product [Polarella glacialis]|uniref:Uncharacterized protein n=1 Tax=Polarella glacialis TaxID=89957 RepID=A0A813LMF6_POLGL|nr:unnamed protein product [Polarella glacialis]CAE8734872.1 unnamed protein product [Polarella glacialis]